MMMRAVPAAPPCPVPSTASRSATPCTTALALPASDFTSPSIAGWKEDVPGNEVLQFDEAEAKRLWDQAEAISSY